MQTCNYIEAACAIKKCKYRRLKPYSFMWTKNAGKNVKLLTRAVLGSHGYFVLWLEQLVALATGTDSHSDPVDKSAVTAVVLQNHPFEAFAQREMTQTYP